MVMLAARVIAAVALVLLPVGCSASHRQLRKEPPAALADAASVVVWEGLARPDLLHLIAGLLAAVDASKGDCPRVDRDGTLTVVTADCTDGSGSSRSGRARIVTREGEVRAHLRGFGDPDGLVWGSVRVTTEGPPRFALDVRVQSNGPMRELAPGSTWLAIDARGRRDPRGRWTVEGELAAEGRGRVRIRGTELQLDDELCPQEPLAGLTELWAGEHHVEIRYDGAIDCDDPGTARWWRNGVDQGELQGIAGGSGCSVATRRSPDGLGALGLALLLLLGARPRRIAGRDGRRPAAGGAGRPAA
jgi:hypothetical protein